MGTKFKIKFFAIMFGILLISFLAFLISALCLREANDDNYLTCFICAGACLLAAIIFLIILWFVSKKYNNSDQKTRVENVHEYRIYQNPDNLYLSKDEIVNLLDGYESLLNAKDCFYKKEKNIFGKITDSYSVIIINEVEENDLDFDKKKAECKERTEFLKKNLPDNSHFFNCIILDIYDNLTEEIVKFYYNFVGYHDLEVEADKMLYDYECTNIAVGLDKGEFVFYEGKFSDNGLEVDLSCAVKKIFSLNKHITIK